MPQLQASDPSCIRAERIRITGTVQGVGFRPFAWQLAQQFTIRGQIWNDAEGVVIQAWGEPSSLEKFRDSLNIDIPPLAQIEAIDTSELNYEIIPDDFQIIDSQTGDVLTNISPDAATCPQCLAELNDPENRRFRYPFTNCTHCGPRLSIIKSIPYDRDHTSMQAFTMCPQCQEEYDNPGDRRFHAQPNACKNCGPSVWLEDGSARKISGTFIDDVSHAANLIQQGYIVAIKGIGGFHLACDATNAGAVRQLRQRKLRYHKPFAMMARDVAVIRHYAKVDRAELDLLQDKAAPIVILAIKSEGLLPADIAPAQSRIGFMLPYTPLHSLLLQELDVPVVMTSGNRSDESQCISNKQARQQLTGIADYFLMHDRDIVNRLDDSVARIIHNAPQILRRARGYAPQPINLPKGFDSSPDILAMGAELKNSFCLIKNAKAIVSQHQGDLEDASVFHAYRDNITLYQMLYSHKASLISVDQHPDYISTKYGQQLAAEQAVKILGIQHHHAHIAACMVEHDLALNTQPVLGVCLDGLGYGDQAALWGGEFLLADYCQYEHLAGFEPVAMPGGTKAILQPWRNTVAHLQQSLGWVKLVEQYSNLSFIKFMQGKPVDNILTMISRGLNSPVASSAGRLFDAVAALLGLCRDSVSYEGQAAMQLEALAEQTILTVEPYPGDFMVSSASGKRVIQWGRLWQGILSDLEQSVPVNIIAGRFHLTLSERIQKMVALLSLQHDFNTVVLVGGVMQNRLLVELLISGLSAEGYTVLLPRQIPVNDGGISLGQAAVAAAQSIRNYG